MLMDEMYQIADSRSSQTKLNKLFTYFIVQTRKRDVDLYVCTHSIENVDVRLRRAADIRGSCRYSLERPCKKCKCKKCGGTGRYRDQQCDECAPDNSRKGFGSGGTGEYHGKPCEHCLGYGQVGMSRVYFLDRRLRKRYTMDLFANKYWFLFNTRERIPMQARILQGIDTITV